MKVSDNLTVVGFFILNFWICFLRRWETEVAFLQHCICKFVPFITNICSISCEGSAPSQEMVLCKMSFLSWNCEAVISSRFFFIFTSWISWLWYNLVMIYWFSIEQKTFSQHLRSKEKLQASNLMKEIKFIISCLFFDILLTFTNCNSGH